MELAGKARKSLCKGCGPRTKFGFFTCLCPIAIFQTLLYGTIRVFLPAIAPAFGNVTTRKSSQAEFYLVGANCIILVKQITGASDHKSFLPMVQGLINDVEHSGRNEEGQEKVLLADVVSLTEYKPDTKGYTS